MDEAVRGDHAGKRIDVGRLDLREFAVLEHERRELVFGGKLLEHAGVGREAALGLLQGGQADYIEQDMGKLLGGIDVELLPADR